MSPTLTAAVQTAAHDGTPVTRVLLTLTWPGVQAALLERLDPDGTWRTVRGPDGDQIVVTGWWDPGHASDARGEAEGLVVVVDGTVVHRHTIPETEVVVGVGMFDDVFAVGLKLHGYFVEN